MLHSKYKHKAGFLVDLGCGEGKQPNFIGIDRREVEGVDIVHDLEDFPWPLPDESCHTLIAKHLYEHIKPWHSLDFMNEAWRILKIDGQFAMAMPYGLSFGYQQDPTHCNPANQATWQYFDPDYPLFQIYRPKPWRIEQNLYQPNGNLEVVLKKRDIYHRHQALKLTESPVEDGKIIDGRKLKEPSPIMEGELDAADKT
jgi:predicted SAM-dependent methyltransferase